DEQIQATMDIIARTAKLEFKVVDDCKTPGPQGCTVSVADHTGSEYMLRLTGRVGSDKNNEATDPVAKQEEIRASSDFYKSEEGGGQHRDFFLIAYDREEVIPVEQAKALGCFRKDMEVKDGQVRCNLTGRQIIERFVNGIVDKDGKVIA